MRHTFATIVAMLAFIAIAGAQVTVIGAGSSSLSDIVGTETRVTVVTKDVAAEVPNLRLTALQDTYFATIDEDGAEAFYPFSAVREIRVQGGVVDVQTRDIFETRGLSQSESKVLNDAVNRVREIFRTSQGEQEFRMAAAALLMITGEEDEKTVAQDYLQQLLDANDIKTRVQAAASLYQAGVSEPAKELSIEGLGDRNRSVRAMGAMLAGLTRNLEAELQLNRMVRDRAADVSAPAAWALGRIGSRQSLPTILAMLSETNEDKSDAAVEALISLGGDEIIEQAKLLLERNEGAARFRAARVLHALGDETGTNVIRNEFLESQAVPIRHLAAVILAQQQDIKALQVLREELRSRYDPRPDILLRRAEAAAALIAGGDRTYMGTFQELLGQSNQYESNDPRVQILNQIGEAAVLEVIAQTGVKSLMATISPSIANYSVLVALSACDAAIQLANDEYRERSKSFYDGEIR